MAVFEQYSLFYISYFNNRFIYPSKSKIAVLFKYVRKIVLYPSILAKFFVCPYPREDGYRSVDKPVGDPQPARGRYERENEAHEADSGNHGGVNSQLLPVLLPDVLPHLTGKEEDQHANHRKGNHHHYTPRERAKNIAGYLIADKVPNPLFKARSSLFYSLNLVYAVSPPLTN